MSTGSPLDHIVQHPIATREADFGALTPEGVITLFSDHISMILLGGVLLMLVLPLSLRRKKSGDEIEEHGPERLLELHRGDLPVPAQGDGPSRCCDEHTDRFIKYIWSVFFFVLTLNLLGMVPISAISPGWAASSESRDCTSVAPRQPTPGWPARWH